MQAIAENGGGRYYYIEHPTQMARVFQEELGSLFETCARDVEIEIQRHGDRAQSRSRGLRRRLRHERRPPRARRRVRRRKALGLAAPGNRSPVVRPRRSGRSRAELQDRQVGRSQQLHARPRGRRDDRSRRGRQGAQQASHPPRRPSPKATASRRSRSSSIKAGKRDEAQKNMTALAKDLEAKNATLKDERVRRKIEADQRRKPADDIEAAASPTAQQGLPQGEQTAPLPSEIRQAHRLCAARRATRALRSNACRKR